MSSKIQDERNDTCLECGAPLRGRRDQQFCSLTCKNAHHNREQRAKRHTRAEILAALSRNYSILEALLDEGTPSAGMEDLVSLGFDPEYVTAHRRGRFGHDECACFDIWFCRTGSRIFNVRRKVSGERLSVPSPGPTFRR